MSLALFNRDGSAKSEERHGMGVLTLRGEEPDEATGCLLTNGDVTDAICLAALGNEQVWARKIETNKHLYRRGRLVIEPGVALRFVDEASADVPVDHLIGRPSLEHDLFMSRRIELCVRGKLFALLLYLALDNVVWRHNETGKFWFCSSRRASEIVDRLRGDAGTAIWYSLIYEQTLPSNYLDEGVVAEIAALGWAPILDETRGERITD